MTDMDTCTKCGTTLRKPNSTFCPVCGTAQKPDAPNTVGGKVWQARLRATQYTSVAWQLLWVLTGPLAAVLFPLHLRAANLRLRRHVNQRVAAPVLATPRFKDADEGRQIVQRLASAGGGWATLAPLGSFFLAAGILALVFLSPLSAPSHVPYESALESVLNGNGFNHRTFHYVGSAGEYEAMWKRLASAEGPTVSITVDAWEQSYPGSPSYPGKTTSPPYWDGTQTESVASHRPFEYLRQARYDTKSPQLFRVSGMYVATRYGRMPVSAIIWSSVALLYVSYLVLGVQFWRRFARHVTAEAFAAAYARSDTGLLDKLLPRVKARNAATIIGGIIMAVFPLQLLLFPFISSFVFAAHESWEHESGVADALGV